MQYSRIILAAFFCLISATLFSQNKDLHPDSDFIYVYQINQEEAVDFYTSKKRELKLQWFHTLVDSLPIENNIHSQKLDVGNYLLVKAKERYVNVMAHEVTNYVVHAVDQDSKANIKVIDVLTNQPIDGLSLKVKNEQAEELADSSYHIKKNGHHLLTISTAQVVSFHELYNNSSSPFLEKTGKVVSFPFKQALFPFRKVISNISDYGFKNGVVQLFREKNFNSDRYKGYIVFDKPKYLPNDTVRFKAFILNHFSKPVTDSLLLNIKASYPEYATVKEKWIIPISEGAFTGQYIHQDTLKASEFIFSFRDKKKRNVENASIRIEDYELDEVNYNVSLPKTSMHRGDLVKLIISGTDANGIPVKDARVHLQLTPSYVTEIHQDELFVPKKIWDKEVKLDPNEPTIILVPDSLILNGDIEYRVKATFNNSNNESHVLSKRFYYDNRKEHWTFKKKENRIEGKFFIDGKSASVDAKLTQTTKSNSSSKTVKLPFSISINPQIKKYTLTIDSLERSIDIYESDAGIYSESYRTKDSVHVIWNNPYGLKTTFSVVDEKEKLIHLQTSSDSLWKFSFEERKGKSFSSSAHFIFGGYRKLESDAIHFDKNKLTIEWNIPEKIYPGQKIDASIVVKDVNGNPVENVNLTAGSVNDQFEEDLLPELPNLGKPKVNVRLGSYSRTERKSKSISKALNKNWRERLNIDQKVYYQLLYPENGAMFYSDSIGSPTAQFAPYLIDNGKFVPLYMIYVDQELVWYEGTDNAKVYSIITSEGKHSVTLRTKDKRYVIDSLSVKKGFKLEAAFDVNHLPEYVSTIKVSDELSDYEKYHLNNSLLYLKNLDYNSTLYLWQDKRFVTYKNRYQRANVFGPFSYSSLNYAIKDRFKTSFSFEPNYTYHVSNSRIKMISKSSSIKELSGSNLPQGFGNIISTFSTAEMISEQPGSHLKFTDQHPSDEGSNVKWFSDQDFDIHYVILQSQNDSLIVFNDFSENKIKHLIPGKYTIYFVGNSSQCLVKTCTLYEKGTTYINLRSLLPVTLDYIIEARLPIKRGFPEEWTSSHENLNGRSRLELRVEHDGNPLPFANVILLDAKKQFVTGKTTNKNGVISTTPLPAGKYTIEISYVGFTTKKIQNIILKPNGVLTGKVQLDEVSDKTINTVMLQSSSASYSKKRISRIPGIKSYRSSRSKRKKHRTRFDSQDKPFFHPILKKRKSNSFSDEMVYYNEVEGSDLSLGLISNLEANKAPVLHQVMAEADVDFRFDSIMNLSSILRTEFKDKAWWKPNLITDKEGKVYFNIRYPDNITQWKNWVIAMDGEKHTGIHTSYTKSYKPLMARLSAPRFLIDGDIATAIGKVVNYTEKEQKVSSYFKHNNDRKIDWDTTSVTDIHVKTLTYSSLRLPKQDSVTLSFILENDQGYTDGEERKIPLLRKGTEEVRGEFFELNKEERNAIPLLKYKGNTTVIFHGSDYNVLLDELDTLVNYPFDCMEQTASKLKGLLQLQNIQSDLEERKKYGLKITALLKKLKKSQHDDGSWGWWPRMASNSWMTCYVTEALQIAEQNGYRSKSYQKGLDYIRQHIDTWRGEHLLHGLLVLAKANADVEYLSYLNLISKKNSTVHSQLMQTRIQQLVGIPHNLNQILSWKKQTIKGNFYWGNESSKWYDNHIANTLLAYQIIRTADSTSTLLPNIRNYFLESADLNKWRNTIEKATILETILPDVLANHSKDELKTEVVLTANGTKTIKDFPYKMSVVPQKTPFMTFEKKGVAPVYCSIYEKKWNKFPKAVDSLYVVNTWFEKEGKKQDTLEAGKPVVMKVEIEVKKTTQYAMIEIPIPAGCSYEEPTNNSFSYSIRRKHKLMVFEEHLSEGKHVFEIKLEPRFSGKYTVNPVKVESMYFPTFMGRNDLKKAIIRSN